MTLDLDALQALSDAAAGEAFLPFGWQRLASALPDLIALCRAQAAVVEAARSMLAGLFEVDAGETTEGPAVYVCVTNPGWDALREAIARLDAQEGATR